jgi:hypothetical protein
MGSKANSAPVLVLHLSKAPDCFDPMFLTIECTRALLEMR